MWIPELLLFSYFSYVVAYAFTLSAAGCLLPSLRLRGHPVKASIVVFLPAYKEDTIIYSTAREALQQRYPAHKFKVVVIADSLKAQTLKDLNALPVKVIEVHFKKSTKVKALNRALAELPQQSYELGLILDADNLMEPYFLEKINAAYQQGHQAIQAQRVAKNKNTPFAYLDALSEAINNHIYRRGTYALGGSASLTGSGMAFHYPLLKQTLEGMHSVGGFDREMEVLLLGKGIKACYLANAKVYDEKVEKPEVFQNQRKRWIASQFKYLRKYFRKGVKAFFLGNFAYANSALLRNIQLPRLLNLGLLFFLCLGASFLPSFFWLPVSFWWLLLGINVLSIVLAIPKKMYTKGLFKAVLNLPKAFGIMLLLLFKLKGANNKFIHTPHNNPENFVS